MIRVLEIGYSQMTLAISANIRYARGGERGFHLVGAEMTGEKRDGRLGSRSGANLGNQTGSEILPRSLVFPSHWTWPFSMLPGDPGSLRLNKCPSKLLP